VIDSIEATVEEDSKDMIKYFIRITLGTLKTPGTSKVTWPTVVKECQLRLSAYDFIFSILTCSYEQMEYCLKDRCVKTANDGAIIMRHSKGIWGLHDNDQFL